MGTKIKWECWAKKWEDKLPNLAKAYRCQETRINCIILQQPVYAITTWGATLGLKELKNGLAWIFDPNAIDAGMFISVDEIQIIAYKKN